jgi:hypothetical protein
MTEAQISEHNRAFEEAAAIVQNEIALHERPDMPAPGWWLRRRLRRALSLFARVLELNPENWSAMWLMGKCISAAASFQPLFRGSSALTRSTRRNPMLPARHPGARWKSGRTMRQSRLLTARSRLNPPIPAFTRILLSPACWRDASLTRRAQSSEH